MNVFHHAQHIRDVLFYTKQYANIKIVFFIDENLCKSHAIRSLVKDIVQMINVGIKVVLVPGLPAFKNTPFVVDAKQISDIQNTSFDIANTLITEFARHRQTAVIGNWIRARGLGVVNEVDHQYCGHIEKMDTDAINKLLDDGVVPIIPSVGWSFIGKPYYIDPKDIAVFVSTHIKAKKLFFLLQEDFQTSVQALLNIKKDTDTTIRRLTLDKAKAVLEKVTEKTFCTEILERAVWALLNVHNKTTELTRVHILSGENNKAVLNEVFSNKGVGFMVYSDEYNKIIPLQEKDITSVLEIMQPYIKKKILINRNAQDILQKQNDFFVYKTEDNNICGVAALHDIEESCAEIAAIAVSEEEEYTLGADKKDVSNVGKRLVAFLMQKAKKKGYKKIFVFTLQTGDWFERMGFVQIDPHTELPQKRLQKYIQQARNSRVYCIDVSCIEELL